MGDVDKVTAKLLEAIRSAIRPLSVQEAINVLMSISEEIEFTIDALTFQLEQEE